MRPRGLDPAADLIDFLRDQEYLNELSESNRSELLLLAEAIPPAVIYDPVIRTRSEKISIGAGSRIDSFVKLEGGEGLTIGRYVHIASFAHLGIGGGTLFVDDYSAVASGGRIISGSNQPDAITMSACAPTHLQHVEKKITRIGRYAVVLTNAVVLPGITLGEGAVLAAGAVATKDIPAWEIWAGIPAKKIANRVVRR